MWIPGWHNSLEDNWNNMWRGLQLLTALSAHRTDDGRLSGFLPAFGLNSQQKRKPMLCSHSHGSQMTYSNRNTWGDPLSSTILAATNDGQQDVPRKVKWFSPCCVFRLEFRASIMCFVFPPNNSGEILYLDCEIGPVLQYSLWIVVITLMKISWSGFEYITLKVQNLRIC